MLQRNVPPQVLSPVTNQRYLQYCTSRVLLLIASPIGKPDAPASGSLLAEQRVPEEQPSVYTDASPMTERNYYWMWRLAQVIQIVNWATMPWRVPQLSGQRMPLLPTL